VPFAHGNFHIAAQTTQAFDHLRLADATELAAQEFGELRLRDALGFGRGDALRGVLLSTPAPPKPLSGLTSGCLRPAWAKCSAYPNVSCTASGMAIRSFLLDFLALLLRRSSTRPQAALASNTLFAAPIPRRNLAWRRAASSISLVGGAHGTGEVFEKMVSRLNERLGVHTQAGQNERGAGGTAPRLLGFTARPMVSTSSRYSCRPKGTACSKRAVGPMNVGVLFVLSAPLSCSGARNTLDLFNKQYNFKGSSSCVW
jgi:hypothetical protein